MTPRETEIHNLIASHPLITQQEIADALQITRSSVSVYITAMMRKGIIKGRGYIVEKGVLDASAYPLVVGTMAADIIGEASSPIPKEGARIIDGADISCSYGGCAKHIAENLLRFGYAPRVISAVGNDAFGKGILAECQEHGIAADDSLVLEGFPTSIYMETRSSESDSFQLGLVNCKIMDYITPEFLHTKYLLMKNASQVVLDDSMQAEAFEHITSAYSGGRLYLVTSARATRLLPYLSRFSGIVASVKNLLFLFPDLAPSVRPASYAQEAAISVALRLMGIGVRCCLFTFSDGTLCYFSDSKLSVIQCNFRDGASEDPMYQRFTQIRDSIAAALVYGHDQEYPVETLLRFVAATRRAAVLSKRYVNHDLSLARIRAALEVLDDRISVHNLGSM